ncbi:MAG: Arc family DNA-binding protein [Planctomycetota bacterium]|nr:Arc family DNA-binding protein [Planctomycetota bacterium]
MTESILREVEFSIVEKLKQRAEKHHRSVEEEHRAILRDTLLGDGEEAPAITFEAYLRTMPDVGMDTDFSRIEGSIRDVDLAN